MKKRFLTAIIALLLLCMCAASFASEPAPEYPDRYWKADGKSSGTLPTRYRTMEDGFPETTDTLPTGEGMDTLRISGSGQYSADQFTNMIADIRSRTEGVICVFDLRQETHGFADGQAMSLYADNNAGNAGLDTEEVTELEMRQINELVGKEVTLKSSGSGKGKKKKNTDGTDSSENSAESSAKKEKDTEGDNASEKSTGSSAKKKKESGTEAQTRVLEVSSVMTEAEVCAAENVLYVRLACTDHLCPTDGNVDAFLEAYRALPDGAWLHFHCAAGVGRTGLFMMMADILRNPGVPLEDIIERQVLMGANDPRSEEGEEGEESSEKVRLLERFYDYAHLYGAGQDAPSFEEYSAGLA